MPNALYDAALRYTDLGLPVIALSGKQPNGLVHPHGLKDALAVPYIGAFTHPRTTGVGIVIPWPYVVVDVDGEEGARSWRDLVGADYIPDRWVARTGRGLHLWFANPLPTGNGVLGEKLDLKGQGGYVAAPPSRHPDGGTYTWLAEPSLDEPPLWVPDALGEWIRLRDAERQRAVLARQMTPRVRHKAIEGGILYATLGWDGLIDGMKNCEPGNRNNYLHWAAATMAEEGATEEDYDALLTAARESGLGNVETVRTIRSAVKSARDAQPYSPDGTDTYGDWDK